jgi:hypothetical protein
MKQAWIKFTATISHLPIWNWWNPAQFLLATPPAAWLFEKADLALVIILFVIAIVALVPRIPSGLRSRLLSFGWYNFLIAGILFLTRWQRIPVLGMDLWRFLHEIIMIIWVITIIRYQVLHRPKEDLQAKVQAYRERFLPKPRAR